MGKPEGLAGFAQRLGDVARRNPDADDVLERFRIPRYKAPQRERHPPWPLKPNPNHPPRGNTLAVAAGRHDDSKRGGLVRW